MRGSNVFFLNPKRWRFRGWRARLKFYFQFPFVRFGTWLGFQNIEYSYVHGDAARLHLGKGVSTTNTTFNTNSGEIHVGDDTVFTHDILVLTGTHRFHEGVRANLWSALNPNKPRVEETPTAGNDIRIGMGCFIGSGAIILGGVEIGDNVIIGAGAVVTKSLPSNCFATGVPAQVMRSWG